MSDRNCAKCREAQLKGKRACLPHAREDSRKHRLAMRKWRYEGGEAPTVAQTREEIAMGEAWDAWQDEHPIRSILRRHGIGEGLRLAAPERRRDRAILALQLQDREWRARWKAEHPDEPYPLPFFNKGLKKKIG